MGSKSEHDPHEIRDCQHKTGTNTQTQRPRLQIDTGKKGKQTLRHDKLEEQDTATRQTQENRNRKMGTGHRLTGNRQKDKTNQIQGHGHKRELTKLKMELRTIYN